MVRKSIETTSREGDSSQIHETAELNLLLTRRRMLEMTSVAGLATLTGISSSLVAKMQVKRPRIACCVSYWGSTSTHADWIITKLLDGYWWQGAHTPSRVEVVAVYIDQLETSQLGQKTCKAKNIPIFKTVGETVTLGGKELAVDGVVIIAEHGKYPTSLKGQWLLPRWWIYQQVIRVFERSKRSVPIFNDKHFSYSWAEAKWMFDKSRELNFPLSGGSSIPTHYRTPEIEPDNDTPIKASVVVADSPDEGALFHCVDVLQSFVERRKGGETGVRSVQWIKGPETWKWTERNPWAANLLESIRQKLEQKPGYFQEFARPNVCIVAYNDGTKAAIYSSWDRGWTYAAEIEGKKEAMIVSMGINNFPGPFSQYLASNSLPHWITEMMVTKKEPFNAERLLLSTGIVANTLESNWENERYSAIGRRIETPLLNITYRPTRGAQFNTGEQPPNVPYIRGFDQ